MRYLFLLLILLLTACGTGSKKNVIPNTLPTPFPTAEFLIAPPEMATPTKWLSPLSATTRAIYAPRLTEAAVLPAVTNPIHIDGATYGLYGKDVTLNAGTDGATTFIGYFVPSGNYRAVSNRTFSDQINVYSSATVFENGYEYAADGKACLIEPGGSTNITVPFGYYVKVVPPADIDLSPISRGTAGIASTPEPQPQNIINQTAIRSSLGVSSSGVSCTIKGNVNSNGECIYHCPNWRDYDKTDMIPAEGDTWFCTEAEAKAAGFRAARYAHGICLP